MAEQHHKSGTGTSTTTRAYTVGYVRDSRTFEPAPAVTLKGHWLAEAGFTTGTPVDVRVMQGCLILTAREPATPPEPEIMQTLKQAAKLSARRQQQIVDFIEAIAKPKKRIADDR